MDISKASNFERFVADLLGRNQGRVRSLFEDALVREGRFDLSADPVFGLTSSLYGFASGRSTHGDRLATIRACWDRFGLMIDPHTADGLKVALEQMAPAEPMIVLETALPIKFAATLVEALGREPERPAGFAGIEDLPRRVVVMDPDLVALKQYIAQHCA